MLFSIVVGLMIFVYAAWTLVQFIRKSKKGKCASCEMNKSCSSACPGVSALGKKRGERSRQEDNFSIKSS
jgi:radical SAM protein with 4Fe4S-binding SPASM domain